MQQEIMCNSRHNLKPKTHNLRASCARGFSVIELLVVTGILVLLTGVILVNNSRFGGKVLLESLAYDIGLTFRQAQVYGISVRKLGPGTYGTGYGLHFDAPPSYSYHLFADVDGNGRYNTGAGELVESNSIQQGYRIQQLCAKASGAAEICTATQLDIVFKRPEPDAWISRNGAGCLLNGNPVPGNCMENARVVVQSPRGDQSSVTIWLNGQVSVQR